MTRSDSLPALVREYAAPSVDVDAITDGVLATVGDDSTGHDMDHARRVYLLGSKLAESTGAEAAVVQAAALTHDLHRSFEGAGEYVDPAETLPAIRALLEASDFPPERIPAVLHCVEVHDEYGFRGIDRPAETLEAEVLRDADNLDAIGAVGIARNFAFTGVVGNPLWDPAGESYSGLGHFDDKLLNLIDEMHTEAAREIAEDRHAFLEAFKDRFEQEWYGEV